MPFGPQDTDSDRIRRLRAGDRGALEELFHRQYGPLVSYAGSLLGNEVHQAEDVAQEAFLRLWKKRRALGEAGSLRALLFTTARNLALNERRDAMNRKKLLQSHRRRRPAAPADEEVAGRLLRKRIRGWIRELPERRREAFELSRFNQLTYEEIAEIMGVSVRTVENHIRLALQALRRRLKEEIPDLLTR